MPGPSIPVSELRRLQASQSAGADTCTGCRHRGSPICATCTAKASRPPGGDPSPTRQRAGKEAKASGQSWERGLETLLDILKRRGLCAWHRTPEPMRKLRSVGGGRWECVAESDGPPDYIVAAGGKSIALEAKHTAKNSWFLRELKAHQAQDLDDWERHGNIGAVALQLGQVEYVLPWRSLGPIWHAWREKSQQGRASAGSASLDNERAIAAGAMSLDVEGRWLRTLLERAS